MKKAITWILVLMMALSMTACAKEPAPTQAPATETTPQEPATETTEEPTEVPTVMAKPLYGEILDSYFDALLQGFDPLQYEEKGLNSLPGMIKDVTQVGYCMEDLDGDGSSELLIGAVDEPFIYAMYTVKDGQEVQVIDAMERSTYELTSDGLILNRGSNGAASYGYNLYSFASGELVFQDGLVFDAGKDEQNPWFYTKSEAWDSDALEPIDTATAEATEQDLLDSVVPVSFIPFSQYTA